jgi:hypothetical protein
MERNYTKNELETKKVTELKEILRIRNLKVSGSKEELINRILNSQTGKPKVEPEEQPTYFKLLPGDINRMVSKYRAENEPNNLLVKALLTEFAKFAGTISSQRSIKMIALLRKYNIPFELTSSIEAEKIADEINKLLEALNFAELNEDQLGQMENQLGELYKQYYRHRKIIITMTEDKLISDETLINFILAFNSVSKLGMGVVNEILKEQGSNLRIIREDILVNNRFKAIYVIGEFKGLKRT